jgi:SAM-dependent methyltransferase
MPDAFKSSKPQKLCSEREEKAIIANHIKQKARCHDALSILEAGCGKKWGLDLEGIQYTLTGIDIDEKALNFRVNKQKDLDISIHGDLRTVALEDSHYDVIYNSNVLEHINGAERVLEKFERWLKPGGILILIIPNRDSVKGFLTRITPFWFHIFYKRYIIGKKNAGKPNHGPFPTFFDKVVSIKGIYEFCESHDLFIKAEYSAGHGRNFRWITQILSRLIIWVVHLGSFKRLSASHGHLIYVIEKS